MEKYFINIITMFFLGGYVGIQIGILIEVEMLNGQMKIIV